MVKVWERKTAKVEVWQERADGLGWDDPLRRSLKKVTINGREVELAEPRDWTVESVSGGEVFVRMAFFAEVTLHVVEPPPPPVPIPALVSVTEAATILGTSRQAVLQRIKASSLRAVKVGAGYVITRESVERIGNG